MYCNVNSYLFSKNFFRLKKFSNLYSTAIRNLFRFATKRIASGFAKSLDPFLVILEIGYLADISAIEITTQT